MIQIYSLFDPLVMFSPFEGKTAVDIGCGTGETVNWLAEQGCRSAGVDSLEMIEKVITKNSAPGKLLIAGKGERLPFKDDAADLVLFNASLHHIPQSEMFNALKEAFRILRKDGKIAVVEPLVSCNYYQVTRLAEEETEIRGKAQEALVKALESGMSLELKMNFYIERSWEDFIQLTDLYFKGSEEDKSQLRGKARSILESLSKEADCDPVDFRFQSACSMVVLGKG